MGRSRRGSTCLELSGASSPLSRSVVALVAAGPAAASPAGLADPPTDALTGAEARDVRAPKLRSSKLVFGARDAVFASSSAARHTSRSVARGTVSIKTSASHSRPGSSAGPGSQPGPNAKAVRVVLVRKMPFRLKGATHAHACRHVSRDKFLTDPQAAQGRTRVDVTVVGRDIAGNVATSMRRVALQPPGPR